MGSKVKTSIVIDRDLWKRFRERVVAARGSRSLSEAVEEALREELVDTIVLEEIEETLQDTSITRMATVEPVKPRAPTRAEEVVRELRDSRT